MKQASVSSTDQGGGKRRAGRGGVISGTVAVGSPTLLGSASRIPKLQAAALDTRGHASERRDAQPRLVDAAGAALTSGLMRW